VTLRQLYQDAGVVELLLDVDWVWKESGSGNAERANSPLQKAGMTTEAVLGFCAG
jgi:hypothetical protein